eukprot:8249929-Pyramimonas_sp.AAC.1
MSTPLLGRRQNMPPGPTSAPSAWSSKPCQVLALITDNLFLVDACHRRRSCSEGANEERSDIASECLRGLLSGSAATR